MKKASLKKAQTLLLERRDEIIAKNGSGADIDIDGDETDEIQGKTIAAVYNEIQSRDKARLNKIERALTKIENGTFGACEDCEEPIEEKRLMANPEFAICVSCAEQNEMRAKLRRRGIV